MLNPPSPTTRKCEADSALGGALSRMFPARAMLPGRSAGHSIMSGLYGPTGKHAPLSRPRFPEVSLDAAPT